MREKMICDNLKNNRRFQFVIKFIFWVFISYFIIQLSIGAKEIEEKRNIPGLQTTMEFANHYIWGKYSSDWKEFGSKIVYPNALASSCYLEFSSDVGTLMVSSPWGDDCLITQTGMVKGNTSICINIYYSSDYLHVTGSDGSNDYTSYYIEYENGGYIQNPQMEQEIGFTTDEIVKQQEKMRIAFEEEMEKMHQYQIRRAKERRKKFTDFGFITFLLFLLFYSFLKWISINRRADIEEKYPEEVLEETIAKEEEKFLKRRYVLLGCGMAFWIYMLIPVVSEYLLLPIGGTVKEYEAYGISAVITAFAFGLLWKSPLAKKSDMADIGTKIVKSVFRFMSGCIVTLVIIQLGIIFVPRFYSPEWRFYKINLLADGIAFLIFNIIASVKKSRAGTVHDNTKTIEIEGG